MATGYSSFVTAGAMVRVSFAESLLLSSLSLPSFWESDSAITVTRLCCGTNISLFRKAEEAGIALACYMKRGAILIYSILQ